MQPQQPQGPQTGAPPMGGAPATDPATALGMIAIKMDPKALGTLLIGILTKMQLPPNAQGLMELAKAGQPAAPAGGSPSNLGGMQRMIQTPSAQPGFLK
jgi:hypothetical protein